MTRQFYLYQSNKLKTLNNWVASLIKNKPLPSPFDTEQIIVQSYGMSQWLDLALTNQFDIVANFQSCFIGQTIWSLYHDIIPSLPLKNELTIEKMTWILVSILNKELTEHNPHNELKLIQNQIKITDQKQCFQFANTIAHLFDQYLVYRYDWLKSWEENKLIEELGKTDQIWQAFLWRQLIKSCAELKHPIQNRLNIHFQVLQKLKNSKTLENITLPARIIIFGAPSLPILFVDFLYELSRFVPIYFFHIVPSLEYLGDVNKRTKDDLDNNPLLASWCTLGREFQAKLFEYDEVIEIEDPKTALQTKTQVTLLSHVQSLIFENQRQLDSFPIEINSEDDSIQLANCYTPLREIEALHDYLLTQFEKDKTLTLNDCVVMTPNIDLYAPYIEAIFNNAPAERYLPYAISDRKYANLDPIINGFLLLLSLPTQALTLNFLFELLALEPILNRFELVESDLERLQNWFVDSGSIWGLDEKASYNLDTGIDRMLLGYIMQTDQKLWQNLAPYDHIQGQNAIVLGKISLFIQTLKTWKAILAKSYSINDWQQLLTELLTVFFVYTEKSSLTKVDLLTHFAKLREEVYQTEFAQTISHDVIQKILQERISDQYVSNRFLVGKINFGTLMPMRNVPFKVVAVLGLNEKDFPRQSIEPSFNLMEQHPRANDRSRRKDDRYLFLETILSAEKKLYLSYVGRNIQNNEIYHPSVLVDEFIDFIKELVNVNEKNENQLMKQIMIEQTRMPYDVKLFQTEKSDKKYLLSFADQWLPALLRKAKNAHFIIPNQNINRKEIKLTLDDLLKFFNHPIKYFLKYHLTIDIWEEDKYLPNAECFTLNHLDKYKQKHKMLERTIKNQDVEVNCAIWLSQSNKMPQHQFGKILFEELEIDVQQQKEKIESYTKGKSFESFNGSLNIEHFIFDFKIDHLVNNKLVLFRPGDLKPMNKLTLALSFLTCLAAGKNLTEAIFIAKDKIYILKPIKQEEAIHELIIWLNLYAQGLNNPLFMPIDLIDPLKKKDIDKLYIDFFKENNHTNKNMFDLFYQLIYPQVDDLPFDDALMAKQDAFKALLTKLRESESSENKTD